MWEVPDGKGGMGKGPGRGKKGKMLQVFCHTQNPNLAMHTYTFAYETKTLVSARGPLKTGRRDSEAAWRQKSAKANDEYYENICGVLKDNRPQIE